MAPWRHWARYLRGWPFARVPDASWLVILGSAPGRATVFGVSPFFIWRRGVEVVAMVLFRRFEKRNVGSGFWVCGKKWGHVATVLR